MASSTTMPALSFGVWPEEEAQPEVCCRLTAERLWWLHVCQSADLFHALREIHECRSLRRHRGPRFQAVRLTETDDRLRAVRREVVGIPEGRMRRGVRRPQPNGACQMRCGAVQQRALVEPVVVLDQEHPELVPSHGIVFVCPELLLRRSKRCRAAWRLSSATSLTSGALTASRSWDAVSAVPPHCRKILHDAGRHQLADAGR